MVLNIDHATLRLLMAKKDIKLRLIKSLLVPQQLDFEVKDKRGCKNQVDDRLSRLESNEKYNIEFNINHSFPHDDHSYSESLV